MAEGRRRFRFLKELAQGGFGKVYLAEMLTGENFSSVVAIKILHARWAENTEVVMRSRDEARLLGRLRHRSIVRVEGLTRIQQQVAIVMEYLEGADLKAIMNTLRDQGRPFPRQAAFEGIGAIAAALDAAYNQVPLSASEPLRVIHRDIKPSNAMLTVEGDVKVLDFGTARASFEHREAKTQALAFGSAAYMSPERLMGEDDTPAADVFSLGITLYELLTLESFGKIPVRYERFERTIEEKIQALDLSALPEPTRAPARETMRRLMAYEPGNRPTAAEVVEWMETLAESCRDGGLKRFSREFVREVMNREIVEPDPNDPFTGLVFYEDTGSLPGTIGEAGREDGWAGESDVHRNPLHSGPAAHVPSHTIVPDDDPIDELPVLPPPPDTLMQPPAPPPYVEPVAHEASVPTTPGQPYASSRTLVYEDANEPTVLTSPFPAGVAHEAPAMSAGRAEPHADPVPPRHGPGGQAPIIDDSALRRGPVGGYPQRQPARATGTLVAGSAVVLSLAGALAWFMLREEPPPGPATPPTTTASSDLRPGDAAPDTTPNAAGRGSLVLRVDGRVKDVVVSTGETPTRWDGSLYLNLRDLPPSKVRAMATPETGRERMGGTVNVVADHACAWTLRDGVWVTEDDACR